jgi:hypothetical protein
MAARRIWNTAAHIKSRVLRTGSYLKSIKFTLSIILDGGRYRRRGELLPHQGGCTGTPTLAKGGGLAVNDQQANRILDDTFATAGLSHPKFA